MDWLGFVGSVIGGSIGGLFTYFGVKLTLRHEDKKKFEEERKQAIDKRPRLKLLSFKSAKEAKINSKADLNALMIHIDDVKLVENKRIRFYYDEKALDINNLVCLEYKFKNNGLTEIDDLSLVCNLPKDTAIIDMNQRETYIEEQFLNYTVWSDKRFIKPNETVTIKLYYIKDKAFIDLLSAPCVIYMRDINGRYWYQPLFVPPDNIDDSVLCSYKDFKDASDIDIAIKCFKGEMFW